METNDFRPLTRTDCYCFLIASILAADGERTTTIAAGALVAHDFGITMKDAVEQIESACMELASSRPEKKQSIIQSAVTMLKRSVSPEDLTTLYFRIETIARADGIAEVEQESLRMLRSDWGIPDSAYEDERRRMVKANSSSASQKNGCAIFLLGGLGLIGSGCSLLV